MSTQITPTERQQKVQALEQKAREIAMKARELQEREREEVQRPILREMVGKCFKFKNSYGSGSPDWWLYARIVSLDEKAMTFKAVRFQHTSRNHIEIEHSLEFNFNWRTAFGVDSSWMPISASEYKRALSSLRQTIERLVSA